MATPLLTVILLFGVRLGAGYDHIGCFRDDASRALDHGPGGADITIEACHEWSVQNGYTYFALQHGGGSNKGECRCSNSLSEATQFGTANNCEAGTGGGWANDLYQNTDLDISSVSHWIAAGDPTSSYWNGIPNVECRADSSVEASQGTSIGDADIGVSCCSDDGSAMRYFYADDNSDCRQAKTFEEAAQMCDEYGAGYRLCTLEEMLGGKTKDMGCSHDSRYNWVSTPCGAGTGHVVAQGDHADGNCNWQSAAADWYCQSDSSNQAAYQEFSGKHVLDIGIRCCYEDESGNVNGWSPTSDCNGKGLDNVEPATYDEAVSLCSANGMRLCTKTEMLDRVTERTGCWFDCAYIWVEDECEIDVNSAAMSNVAGPIEVTGSEQEATSFDDFIPMVIGAAAGAVAIVGIVAVVVVMRERKTASKKTEIEMKAVHVPDHSVATKTNTEMEEEKETEAEMEVVTGPEPDVGAVVVE